MKTSGGFKLATVAACLLALGSLSARAAVLADSVADYSGTQGYKGWYYGYYDSPPWSTDAFKLMSNFDAAGNWTVDYPLHWTSLDQTSGHPNGTITSGAALPDEQWAVRRWVSWLPGQFTISGDIADVNPGGGNGVIARVFVDGAQVFSWIVENGQTALHHYEFGVNLASGSKIDFAIDPRDGNDHYDRTTFTATIVPEPAAALLFALSGLGMLRRRKRSLARTKEGAIGGSMCDW